MDNIKSHKNELPSAFSERASLLYSSSVTTSHKKDFGQYFTPLEIAKFMGSLATTIKTNIRILDPGCGGCVLSCALIEALVEKNGKLKEIELVAYEIDTALVAIANVVLSNLKKWLKKKGIAFKYTLNNNDFLHDNSLSLFTHKSNNNYYDIVVSNPPYFKLSMDDGRVDGVKNIIYGQPNIYTLFLYVSATLLNEGGDLIFITPRSFACGNYYKMFRNEFFSLIQLKNIHLFDSRKDAFNRDNVLQENVILHGKKEKSNKESLVAVTTSFGLKDLVKSERRQYKLKDLIDFSNGQKILHLPTSEKDHATIKLFRKWSSKLSSFNIQISTGPVVSFRSADLLYLSKCKDNLVPLLILHNAQKMNFIWPIDNIKKPQYISFSKKSQKLLIPNKNYILLRRFSSKDDKSRLIAAPFFTEYSDEQFIGIENHLNYIYRPNGELGVDEIYGLSLLLNSTLYDAYFRTFNGTINVSATELREMPLPPLEIIKKIGISYNKKKLITQAYIDELVNNHIKQV